MAQMQTLHDAFLDELRDAYDAEKQLLKALPRMAKAAESDSLRDAFETHRQETVGHVDRLEQVFAGLEERVRGKHCEGMAGIIEEGKGVMEEDADGTTLDALLIASAQRAEHYEMAAYGTLVAWARAMGHQNEAGLLQEILDQEKATDEKLTQLAEAGINQSAAQGAHGEDNDEGAGGNGSARGGGAWSGRGGGMSERTGGRSGGGRSAAAAGGSRSSGARASGSRSSGSRAGSRSSRSGGSRSAGSKKR
ncbi:MAG TPA: ferritin-like domain-containing protein [Vicinamibacterales bacterium]|nr:ferritin-like domain-containing protein [Vicinamibacterales bacterium]